MSREYRPYRMCSRCRRNLTVNKGGVCLPCLDDVTGRPLRRYEAARRVAASYNAAGEPEARLTKHVGL